MRASAHPGLWLLSIGEPGEAAKPMSYSLEMFFRIYAEWVEQFGKQKNDNHVLKASELTPARRSVDTGKIW